METEKKNKITLARLWRLCPFWHAVLLAALLWILVYFTTRENTAWMCFLARYLVRPWHRGAGRLFSLLPFSVAEWVEAFWIGLAVAYLVRLWRHYRRREGWNSFYRWVISLLAIVSAIFGLFSLWWGVLYYTPGFADTEGLEDRPISAQELQAVTEYFARQADELAPQVDRDEEGVFTADLKELFDHSRTLYHGAETIFPSLTGPELRAKPVIFSKVMSVTNTTGFFFPFTAEANINVDCPMALLPATIGHELAHQRGVALEDEANFVGILACMEDGDPTFAYSGALMAYVYLGNALHDTDYDAWQEIALSLDESVQHDLAVHNAYWDKYDTKAREVSDQVYEVFLETYGDDRGMQSYDACVDLLVSYYLDRAL
ncbi:MAG: DUF3810 domain-containing protein [Oscillospiraceae bacterium]|nr:DUF3810 domain-containing protein [Oscillospiraceae bacterium]